MTGRIRPRVPISFEHAIRYAREWDVNVIIQPDSLFTEKTWTHAGPVAGGIHWPTRTILWSIDDVERIFVAPFLHEVSHVISGVDPGVVSELDDVILALDHAAFHFLGAPRLWHTWMANFSTLNGDWPKLPKHERDDYLLMSQFRAQDAGLLNAKNEPTFTRRKAVSHAA